MDALWSTVGYSALQDSFKAGADAATQALETPAARQGKVALLFASPKHDAKQIKDGVRSVLGSAPRFLGGGTMGVITNDQLGYDGFHVGLAVLGGDDLTVDLCIAQDIAKSELQAGKTLGRKILEKDYPSEPNVLLFYDSIKEARTSLNLATPMIQGLKESLGAWPPIAGVGILSDLQFNPFPQFYDDALMQHTLSALVLSGGVKMHSLIVHGCCPVGSYHTITKTDENVVLEIDGRPATDVIAELVGPGTSWEEYPLFVTLGINRGDKFAPFDPKMYNNRLTMAVDKMRKGLVMFENDLEAGMEFQLMQREIGDFQYIREQVSEFLGTLKNTPFFAMYIDCAGRAARYCGSDGEEAAAVQKALGKNIPLLGLYSGVELAPINHELRALDWTGVLCLLTSA